MKPLLEVHPWKVVESGFQPEHNRIVESITSLGNGYMGMRGNFEEAYSGDSLQGTYIAGVYYPDRTVVGWWKVGYPEYYAKVLNAVNFIGIDVTLGQKELDLHQWQPRDFKRCLDMQEGELSRRFRLTDEAGRSFFIETKRFVSMEHRQVAAVSYSITLEEDPAQEGATLTFSPYLDGNVVNEDANYGEDFWLAVAERSEADLQLVAMETKKSGFVVAAASTFRLYLNGTELSNIPRQCISRTRYAATEVMLKIQPGDTLVLEKTIAVTTSRDYPAEAVSDKAAEILARHKSKRYSELFAGHAKAWAAIWQEADIRIEGDPEAQQGIRFNIFHLNQTYTGDDPRLNIGPKGFTGEKYGGSTYWDTEAYCLPFYLSTSDPEVARNLLLYRYNHLEKARENAAKLGLKGALYPMVTMTGEECHNEWEITFEEIHRNGAIAYAIFNYVRYTGDKDYLRQYGAEVLAEISRFWASRVSFQPRKGVYMILGVTGPNEYENNVNNNWYTNRIAAWCLEYTLEVLDELSRDHAEDIQELIVELNLSAEETMQWEDIVQRMYFPTVEELGVFEQQDGFMDKELLTVDQIPPEELPLNQNWSWDRILRSCFIKQADVLQGLFFLGDRYDLETKRRNFDFYEPMTVHESSLSPCVHSIIAAEVGCRSKAYELYLRTARLDLDNYNNDTDDGLHITSMAGTWMSIVYGFGGLRIEDDRLALRPFAPENWESYSFRVRFRSHRLEIQVNAAEVAVKQKGGSSLNLSIHDRHFTLPPDGELKIPIPS
ncbi:MAG: family 65 glycosyl hydrolase domain-containing protein [Bacillota bacterium]|nr:family 65 glycosyl hydrolase domain-containing protein [Bacillota bacterium]NLJ02767.1 glycoside hydrolase family 65 protein [Bacillota bacterium]